MIRSALVLVAVLATAPVAAAATPIKIATLAPAESPWGKEFTAWAAEVATETKGEVSIDFQWGVQEGDEVQMVKKLRSGQLDGAALTSVGLAGAGVLDALLFQLPGLFSSWGDLDLARNAIAASLNGQFEKNGLTLGGWIDVGAAKMMTVGFEVHHPTDLQRGSCYFLEYDLLAERTFSVIGGLAPRRLAVNEILPMLTRDRISVVVAPPLAADQLEWTSRITHIGSQTMGYYGGAMVFSTARMNTIPQSLSDIITARSNQMSARLRTTVRKEDADAYERLKAAKATYNLRPAEKKEWRDVFAKVRTRLRGIVFTPDLFDKVVQLATAGAITPSTAPTTSMPGRP